MSHDLLYATIFEIINYLTNINFLSSASHFIEQTALLVRPSKFPKYLYKTCLSLSNCRHTLALFNSRFRRYGGRFKFYCFKCYAIHFNMLLYYFSVWNSKANLSNVTIYSIACHWPVYHETLGVTLTIIISEFGALYYCKLPSFQIRSYRS